MISPRSSPGSWEPHWRLRWKTSKDALAKRDETDVVVRGAGGQWYPNHILTSAIKSKASKRCGQAHLRHSMVPDGWQAAFYGREDLSSLAGSRRSTSVGSGTSSTGLSGNLLYIFLNKNGKKINIINTIFVKFRKAHLILFFWLLQKTQKQYRISRSSFAFDKERIL